MLLASGGDCLIICRLMGPDNRSHKQLVVKKTKKNQTYIMSKFPRVVKIAEFFIPFFLPLLQTLTAVGYSV